MPNKVGESFLAVAGWLLAFGADSGKSGQPTSELDGHETSAVARPCYWVASPAVAAYLHYMNHDMQFGIQTERRCDTEGEAREWAEDYLDDNGPAEEMVIAGRQGLLRKVGGRVVIEYPG